MFYKGKRRKVIMNGDAKQERGRPKGERGSFSGKIGYVLAVAGSAVGLGNIWRFPYLAAKYGGGMFLIVYLVLMLTFGYTLIMSETTLGRMTGKSPVGAFTAFGKKPMFYAGGWVNSIVPMIIVPYYCVIGGWVIKYFIEYLKGSTEALAQDSYFTEFIGQAGSVELWFIVFTVFVTAAVLAGVKHGVELASKVMMPVLVVLAVFVSVYSMTRPGALEGVKYFFIPNFKNFSLMTVVAAMGQMFFSLSIAMGILYTYGSYTGRDVDLEKSTKQIEIFDTGIAVLAGLMIIPAVFAFSGGAVDKLNAGPSLMFITLPKVFAAMGTGRIIGILFFVLVMFAALTSAISLMEAGVATFADQTGRSRLFCIMLMFVITLVFGSLSAFGFNILGEVTIFGMSFLDFFDFLSNSILMPIAALATCVLILRVAGLDKIASEVEISSEFKRRKMYNFVLKYIAPAFLVTILVSSVLNVLGIIKM